MEAKPAEMEQLQAEEKSVDSAREQHLARHQEHALHEQERLNREAEAFLKAADEREDEFVLDPMDRHGNYAGG